MCGVGSGHRPPDIVSDTSRMPVEAQRGLGRMCLARPQGRGREGRESDLVCLHNGTAFFLDKKKEEKERQD